jgi:hypothetical protein
MKLSDTRPKVIDEVITEVWAIKRAISERHGNDIDRLLASLISQERAAGIGQGDQASNEQSAIRSEFKSDGSDNPHTESEERSR